MSHIRNFCNVEPWTVSQLIDACGFEPLLKSRIKLPEFQRQIVWSQEKREKLIQSIKNGYPFGSLLLFEIGDDEYGRREYSLIDGLQRTHAIRSYVEQPTQFFTSNDVSDELIDFISRELEVKNVEKVRREIVIWVRNLRGFIETDGWGIDGLVKHLISQVLNIESDNFDYFQVLGRTLSNGVLVNKLTNFLKETRENADIREAKVPVIIYNGDSSELPTIFELLNSQGVALSRYEIYAAQWMSAKLKIANPEIIDAIWKKYEVLEEEGFSLQVSEDAPDAKSRKSRDYDLFQYLFGFGQYLSHKYPRLFRSISDDRPSSAGFNLIAACIGLRVKDMHKLEREIRGKDINAIESCIVDCVKFVDESLDPILVVRKGSSPSIYHSEYQIISFIATAFQLKYDVKTLDEREGWRSQWKNFVTNLLMFYLFDIFRDYWRGSGDSKLFDVVQSLRYINRPPTQSQWIQVLDNWFLDTQIIMSSKGRRVRDATAEILFLKYLYTHKLTVIQNSQKYHIEHIVPVDRLVEAIGASEDGWPINAIGNLALLEEKPNIAKGNKTFSEYFAHLLRSGQIDQDEHNYLLAHMEAQLSCPAVILPQKVNRESYEKFLLDRFEILKAEFCNRWSNSMPIE